jgi:DNA-binding transcriptional MocR family regulator
MVHDIAHRPVINLSSNYPTAAGQEELTERYMIDVLADSALNLSAPRPYFGDPHDVESVGAALVGSRSGIEDSCFALTCSGQAALAAALAAIRVRPGLRLAAESWTFPKFIRALSLFGASAVPIQMDDYGMVPGSLESLCAQGGLDALYTMPTFHNPLGAVMPVDRCEAVAALARRHDLWVIEDNAYAFLEAELRPTIRSFAPERTLQVFSLSKMVSLELRLGALIMPATCAARAADYMGFAGISAHPVATATAARIARDGHLPALAEAKRAEGAARFEIARAILGERARPLHPYGWHILVNTPNNLPGTRFVERARIDAAVALSPAAEYRLDGSDEPVVRISFGGERDSAVVAAGLRRLAVLFSQ